MPRNRRRKTGDLGWCEHVRVDRRGKHHFCNRPASVVIDDIPGYGPIEVCGQHEKAVRANHQAGQIFIASTYPKRSEA